MSAYPAGFPYPNGAALLADLGRSILAIVLSAALLMLVLRRKL